MKKILLYMFCVLAFISIIACPKTSTEMAEIRISLVKSPLVVDPSPEGWVPLPDEPVVILTELNGVGCDISSVKLELVFEGESGWPITKVGGRINAFGSLSVDFSNEFYPLHSTYERIKITVTGGDDNGFQISAIAYFDIIYSGTYWYEKS